MLGKYTNQLYYVIINVFLKTPTGINRIGYIKIHPVEIWGFENEPEWYPILGVAAPDGSRMNVGNLLMALNCGPEFDMTASTMNRKLMKETKTVEYTLRAHVYQGRKLPASDDNGLSDPFVEIALQEKR